MEPSCLRRVMEERDEWSKQHKAAATRATCVLCRRRGKKDRSGAFTKTFKIFLKL